MLNKKIALSGMSIVAAMSLMAGATFAFFSDTATSTGNTFSTGNASLLIANDSETGPVAYLESISGFSDTNIFPGYDEDFSFWLRNASSSTISLDVIADLIPTSGSEAIQDAVSVKFTCTRQGDSVITTAGPFTINQWEAGQAGVGSLLPGDGVGNGIDTDEAECVMNVTLPTTADNTLAGQSLTFDGKFDATQVAP